LAAVSVCDRPPVITFSGKLRASAVDQIAALLADGLIDRARESEALLVDMRNVSWAYPTGIVGLLTCLLHIVTKLSWSDYSSFGRARVLLPEIRDSKSPTGFLERIGFIGQCERMFVDTNKTEFVNLDEWASRSLLPRRYMDLRRVSPNATNRGDARDDFLSEINSDMLTRFRTWLSEKSLFPGEPEAIIGAATAMQELVMNVFDHAETGGFAYAQQGFGRGGRFVAVVVADTGPGIPQSITPLAEMLSAKRRTAFEAIKLATEKYATSKPRELGNGEYGGGLGLSTLREISEQLNGILYIRSGGGAVICQEHKLSARGGAISEYPGTFVSLYVPVPEGVLNVRS
jgi:hypothetical protein